MSEYKKRWGDRRDARWVREVDGMHAIMPHLMPKRTDAEVYLAARMDVTEALAYLQKKNEGEEEYRATLFHCFIMAVAKTVYLRPLLNRYISGRRVYERDKITLGFVVKKRFEDHSEESLMVTEALEDWTLTEVTKKVVGKVHTVRGQDSFGLDNTLDLLKKLPRPVMMLAMNITTLAVVWYGGNIIIAGDMPVGNLTAFTTYIVQILMSLMMLSMVFLQSSRAMASLKRVNEVMDTRIDLKDDHASHKELQVTEGRVEFRHVDFSYTGSEDELVLEDISFTARPGQTVGIIGSTGSGKTSLVQMIPRLYDVTKGQVLVDGVDVREYSLRNLRQGVGMVLQKNVLFSGTIEENLRWGKEDATEEEIREMAASAQADGFVTSFTNGYDTDMGQGGVNVSGGQKQRLCIARALLKRPRILILDDSTSAVDTATEAKIRECFRTTLKDTTKIIIAQRIGSVEEADLILVLDDGRIIGQGTHEELLKGCGAYQEIYYSQRDREKEEVGAS